MLQELVKGDLVTKMYPQGSVLVSAAQLIGMSATPALIVPAPGAGRVIVVDKAIFKIVRTATAFTGGGAAQLQYGNAALAAGLLALDSNIAATFITGAAGTSYSIRNGAIATDLLATLDNQGLYLSNATGAFAAGTGSLSVFVFYWVTPIIAP